MLLVGYILYIPKISRVNLLYLFEKLKPVKQQLVGLDGSTDPDGLILHKPMQLPVLVGSVENTIVLLNLDLFHLSFTKRYEQILPIFQ